MQHTSMCHAIMYLFKRVIVNIAVKTSKLDLRATEDLLATCNIMDYWSKDSESLHSNWPGNLTVKQNPRAQLAARVL